MARRLIAAAMIPAVLLLGFAPAYALYRCRFDGALRRHCCCAAEADSTPDLPALRERDCCDVEAVRALPSPAAPASTVISAPAMMSSAAVVAQAVACLRLSSDREVRAKGPPPLARKVALLI